MAKKLCVHCGKRVVSRARGLCWRDYYQPGVRDLYPADTRYYRPQGADGPLAVPPAREPTEAPPGTPEKIGVLAGRAARQESLWHPGDAPTDLR
jgi:hypothetical protein